jgi:PII-like signaling protein
VIEIVDTPEKIEQFIPEIDHVIEEGLMTIEDVEVAFYRSGSGD